MNKPLLSVWTWMTATSGTRAGARIFAALALLASAPFGAYAAESGHLGAAPLSAQQAKQPVSGTVTDESGEPLVGVTVMVKNTTTGTTTDAQGHFQLSVEPGATLVFSYLGYNTQEIAVGNKTSLKVALQDNSQNIDEVVVVAYGTQKKVSVTGSVSSVQTKELKQSSSANLSTALAGRLSGLTSLQQGGGQPGKDQSTLMLRGAATINGTSPLILIDGREVKSMDSLAADRIEAITVLKDSVSMAVYGEKAADGVILVTLKKTGEPGDGAQVPGLKGKVVTVTRADSAGTNESTTVRVIGHGTRPKDGTVVVNTAGIAKSYRFKVENGSSVESNPVFIVDGVQVSEIESLDPDQIESMSVIKGTNLPGEFADKGYEGVITITTKQAAAAQRAAAKSAREGIEAGRAGIEAAREGLKLARKYMSSDDWKQAQKALDKAQKELEAARKETSAQLSEAQKAVGTSLKLSADAGHADKVTIQGTPESSVSVYKGQVTLKGGFPDGMLIRINGREASKEDVERLESGKIKRMEVYKGDEAVKRYGEKGRNGVVEIRARR